MKKILILNPFLPTLGGGEKYMGYLCLFLEKYYSDARIDILVHNYLNINIRDKNYIGLNKLIERFGLKLEKTNIIKFDLMKTNSLIDIHKNKTAIEKISSKYDIFIDIMYCSKHAGKAKKNIYICMFPPRKNEDIAKTFAIKLAMKYVNWRFHRSYNYFIAISDYSNYWLSRYWGKSNKYRIIPPPVFLEKDIVNNYDEASKENIILSVGRFFLGSHSKKQLDLAEFFINNIEKLRGYELHLAGGLANTEHDIEYVERIKKIIGSHPVFIHTNAKTEDIVSLYMKAKVFWHASGFGEDIEIEPDKAEHFGITTVEAMSYGVVPIVIRKGGQVEIVTENTGYLWENEAECIEKTIKIIKDNTLRKELAKNAFERSRAFSVEAFFENNRKLFEEIENL